MRGEVPFCPESQRGAARKLQRFYGVYPTRKGLRTFIVKDRLSAPADAIEILEGMGDIEALAKSLLGEYVSGARRPSNIGAVGYHADGGRVHTAICVGVDHDDCLLLFLTSHPTWNRFARPITKEEAAFAGYSFNTNTYLAPVFRNSGNISWSGRRLPSHRIDELRDEFFTAANLNEISRL